MRIPAHSVCTAIRDDIVSGALERGSRLTEDVLARRYGVSRVPVREALRTLEAEGFVVTRRHAGACVAEPTDREAADLLDVRRLLEPLGASRAAERRTDAHLKVLRGLVRLGQERAGNGTGDELRALGGWFHETLIQACASHGLIAMLTQVRHKTAWMYTVEPAQRPAEEWTERGAIVDAVTRRDAERAGTLMAAHTERGIAAHRRKAARRPEPLRRSGTSKHPVNTGSVVP
ncbi:GntR family transcriptional regulator [Streptomyces sp. NPDC058171]